MCKIISITKKHDEAKKYLDDAIESQEENKVNCKNCDIELDVGLTMAPLCSNNDDIEDAFIEIFYSACKKCGEIEFISFKEELIDEEGEDI